MNVSSRLLWAPLRTAPVHCRPTYAKVLATLLGDSSKLAKLSFYGYKTYVRCLMQDYGAGRHLSACYEMRQNITRWYVRTDCI
ncbi:hypothetical protein GGR50DRAFT_651513 [Xylaria sp. CBS 124048]|nr:hypothetical protein GGR50DRAFT_651513 [Xylaria sp. CBS 124048]